MIAIRNYNDTKIELNIARTELNRLIYKKEKIYAKYFNITTKYPSTREITVIDKKTKKQKKEYKLKDENALLKGTHTVTDPMADYMAEMQKIDDETDISLETAILRQQNEVGVLEAYIRIMNNDMAKLKGIEYQLYYSIVIDPNNVNKTISQIIEELSPTVEKEPTTIWHNYYPNIKEYLEKLQIYSENTINCVR